ncbi:hypothetical protein MKJ01_09220 [Chryseobacterium sp. SSA4.19]|uniref:hypothetical protein n=1 Tax=Chryseobacterium sp. SSA4.19 TaxID=2919915 RepID=UPI001F4EC2E0|nr:hypothetical protein [Chryseobacterium sp. SSA4.19]MCJ8153935.1 hypothetical protein [Chryseobacterium sp. SSA4.19]
MRKFLYLPVLAVALTVSVRCKNPESEKLPPQAKNEALSVEKAIEDHIETGNKKKPVDFLPKGYVLFEEVYGDLNNDGLKDCIVIIKATDKDNIILDENRRKSDRNRRGIIVVFKTKNDDYRLIVENDNCFSSENEEGGNYYAPELMVYVEKGNLFIHYAHGYWKYTFRLKGSDFQLIGYDASDNHGPVVNNETSINYLTGKKQYKENTNSNADSGEEVFEESWSKIPNQKPVMLSQIKDFDEFEVP